MSSTKPSVALILVNWNTYSYSRSCIEQAMKLNYPNYSIILVDNGSTDGSGERLFMEFPQIVYLKNEYNQGFTGGNNRGMTYALQAGFDYLFVLNNDTYFQADFLSTLVDYIERHPTVGAVQPLIYESSQEGAVWHAGGSFSRVSGSTSSIKQVLSTEVAYESEWLTGCAILIRSPIAVEVGLLRGAYFAYFEDVDWSFRIRQAGYLLHIVPKAVLRHEVSASTKSKTKQKEGFLSPAAHYLNVRNQFLLLKADPPGLHRWLAWPYQLIKALAVLGYFTLRFRWKKLRAAAAGLRDGLLHRPDSNTSPDITCYL